MVIQLIISHSVPDGKHMGQLLQKIQGLFTLIFAKKVAQLYCALSRLMLFSISLAARSSCPALLYAEKLILTVPLPSVPAVSWASGAQ